jgi:KaiC/GvpD/RAD55 family RecA-like ATPase
MSESDIELEDTTGSELEDTANEANIAKWLERMKAETAEVPVYVAPTPAPYRGFADFSTEEVEDVVAAAKADGAFAKKISDNVLSTFMEMWVRDQAEIKLDEFLNGSTSIKLISEDEIEARPEPEWWVEGLIPKNTITVLAGSGGVGKTFLMLHLARCVASGKEAFIQRSTSRGRVLYVAAEGASAFGSRTRAWNSFHGVTPPPGSISYVESGVNLSSPTSVAKLAEIVKAGEFDLIVLDTYSQLANVDDENSAGKAAAVFRNIKTLRDGREGASVVVVHHTDAGGTKARGSTAIHANSDVVIIAKKAAEGTFTLSTRLGDGGKMKDTKEDKTGGYKLIDHGTSAVVVQTVKPPHPLWLILQPILSDGAVHLGKDLRVACGIEEAAGPEYDAYKTFIARMAKDGVLLKSGPVNNPSYQLPAVAIN